MMSDLYRDYEGVYFPELDESLIHPKNMYYCIKGVIENSIKLGKGTVICTFSETALMGARYCIAKYKMKDSGICLINGTGMGKYNLIPISTNGDYNNSEGLFDGMDTAIDELFNFK